LLVAVAQDGNRNIVPTADAIVEGETKEAWSWFLSHLRTYVTPQPNLCIMSDRGKGLLAALQSDNVGWVEPNAHSVYCIRHIAGNFNRTEKASCQHG
jgi:transposase-like protein